LYVVVRCPKVLGKLLRGHRYNFAGPANDIANSTYPLGFGQDEQRRHVVDLPDGAFILDRQRDSGCDVVGCGTMSRTTSGRKAAMCTR
jgi:hypothetical protein